MVRCNFGSFDVPESDRARRAGNLKHRLEAPQEFLENFGHIDADFEYQFFDSLIPPGFCGCAPAIRRRSHWPWRLGKSIAEPKIVLVTCHSRRYCRTECSGHLARLGRILLQGSPRRRSSKIPQCLGDKLRVSAVNFSMEPKFRKKSRF